MAAQYVGIFNIMNIVPLSSRRQSDMKRHDVDGHNDEVTHDTIMPNLIAGKFC